MLAPCFKTAEELKLTHEQRDALVTVLGMLERGELYEPAGDNVPYDDKLFSMKSWGTCICGHAKRFAVFTGSVTEQNGPCGNLFYKTSFNIEQATVALRDYLTTGQAPHY